MVYKEREYNKTVEWYLKSACDPIDINSRYFMRDLYQNFLAWGQRHSITGIEGTTIQRFSSALRHYEYDNGVTLIHGRSPKRKRWVEVHVRPKGIRT